MATLPFDLNNIDLPTTGEPLSEAWFDEVRTFLQFLARMPQCDVSQSAPQSVANTTATALTFDGEVQDADGMHSTVSNTSRITVVTPGTYDFSTTISFASDPDGGSRVVQFKKNGTTFSTVGSIPTSSTNSVTISGTRRFEMIATDFIEVWVTHDANNALNITAEAFYCKMVGFTPQ